MLLVITAVGPDHRGLADPIVHTVTQLGANIAEIQMYDHDEHLLFSMLTRIELPDDRRDELTQRLRTVGIQTGLSIRQWSPNVTGRRPRLAICTTYRTEPPRALLAAVASGEVPADVAVMIGNRQACRRLAAEFGTPWHCLGDSQGAVDDRQLVRLWDEYAVDYVVLARYMRVLSPAACWKYAGGRIINLHHGLLPSYPGFTPYHDAHKGRMLVYGATCHFIVPELDAGNQTIYQSTFEVLPGATCEEVIALGQSENEPRCLVEGVRRVVMGEVQLHFNRVVALRSASG